MSVDLGRREYRFGGEGHSFAVTHNEGAPWLKEEPKKEEKKPEVKRYKPQFGRPYYATLEATDRMLDEGKK